VIDTRASKNGKYTSVSINVRMDSAQAVINKYVQMSSIEGIISL
jgi:putative lipoic acid-binding regulatory protein